MKEISSLVKEFDDRIELSADRLYDHFGKENGKKQLQKYFSDVRWLQYDDSLYVTDYGPVVEYVLPAMEIRIVSLWTDIRNLLHL